jgi:hypothetical protein
VHKLAGNYGEKQGGFATVAFPLFEEEASTEQFLVFERLYNSARNGGFPHSYHAIQPKDALGLRIVCSLSDLAEEFDAGVRMALGVMFFHVRIECYIVCGREEVTC